MDEIIIEKLEKEDKRLASVLRRLIAFTIDDFICSLLASIVFVYFHNDGVLDKLVIASNEQDIETLQAIVAPLVMGYLLIKLFYLILFFYMYGATFGNMATKTRIINYEHFDSPDFFASISRAIVFMFCNIFLNGVLFLSIFMNKTRRNFADMASKSVVIRVD